MNLTSKAVYENSKKPGKYFCFDEEGCYTVFGVSAATLSKLTPKTDIKGRKYYTMFLEEKVSKKGQKYFVVKFIEFTNE